MRLAKDSIDRFFEYHCHFETRTIYIGDSTGGTEEGVGPAMSEKVIKAIHLLTVADIEKPIRIILNSMGGCWFNGMAIYDAIKACPCHVTIEVMGSAMSMGSIILQAADERILHPNCTTMIHDGYEDHEKVSPRTLEAWADHSKKVSRKKMYEIYAERSKKPVSYWEKRCSHDYILTPAQAIEEGLADKIAGEESENG